MAGYSYFDWLFLVIFHEFDNMSYNKVSSCTAEVKVTQKNGNSAHNFISLSLTQIQPCNYNSKIHQFILETSRRNKTQTFISKLPEMLLADVNGNSSYHIVWRRHSCHAQSNTQLDELSQVHDVCVMRLWSVFMHTYLFKFIRGVKQEGPTPRRDKLLSNVQKENKKAAGSWRQMHSSPVSSSNLHLWKTETICVCGFVFAACEFSACHSENKVPPWKPCVKAEKQTWWMQTLEWAQWSIGAGK